jgi:HEAT repeat protein
VRVSQLPGEDWFASTLGAERLFMGDEELRELLHVLAAGDDSATHSGTPLGTPDGAPSGAAADLEDREAAAVAIGRYGEAAIEALEAILASDDANARWWAARALAEVSGDGAVLPLVSALGDVDPDVRACAALALGRRDAAAATAASVTAAAAAAALANRLADESAFVASIAGDALTMIGESAVTALVDMLADENAHVRLLAVRALGRIKAQGAIAPLFVLLQDPSYLVRYYVQEALEALGVGMVFFKP